MTYKSPYGVPEGLERRLLAWANQLSRDKTFPWVGTGLIDDLKLAGATLGAPPFDELYPLHVGGVIAPPPKIPKHVPPPPPVASKPPAPPAPPAPPPPPTEQRYARPNDKPIEELYREPVRPMEYDL